MMTRVTDDDGDYVVLLTAASQPVITTSELLRQRSNLRPVTRRTDSNDIDDDDASLTMSLPSSTTDEHLRLLREALERIKKSSGTDTDDDDDVDNDDADFVDWRLHIGSIFNISY